MPVTAHPGIARPPIAAIPRRRCTDISASRRRHGPSTISCRFVHDRGIRVLSLMHVGGDGWLKTLDFVPRDVAHLTDVLSGGERADGSSLFGDLGIPVGASDIVMRPRLVERVRRSVRARADAGGAVQPLRPAGAAAGGVARHPRPRGPRAAARRDRRRAARAGRNRVLPRDAGERRRGLRRQRARLPRQLAVRVRRGAAPQGAGPPGGDGRGGQVRPRGGRLRRGRRRRLAGVGAARDRAVAAAAARGRRRRRAHAVGAAQSGPARRHAVQLRAHGAQGPRGQRHCTSTSRRRARGIPVAPRRTAR